MSQDDTNVYDCGCGHIINPLELTEEHITRLINNSEHWDKPWFLRWMNLAVEETANTIRIRIRDPGQFIRFRTKPLGKGIVAVIGFMRGGGSRVQSVIFRKPQWTISKAQAWVKAHNLSLENDPFPGSWIDSLDYGVRDLLELASWMISEEYHTGVEF